MARPLIFSNSYLSVCLDQDGFVRDIYYPHVGLENHVVGHKHRIGVQVDGWFSWLDSDDWKVSCVYETGTMVGKITYTHTSQPIEIVTTDAVYNELPVFLRHFSVHNKEKQFKEVRLFFGQEFVIGETKMRNTGFYDPTKNCVIHYKGRRVFLVNGRTEQLGDQGGIDDYTVGMFAYQGKEGSWRDAEDGQLSKNAVEHGPVDSVVRFTLDCADKEVAELDYWICAAETMDDVFRLNEVVLSKSPRALLHSTASYWNAWAKTRDLEFPNLSKEAIDLYTTSLFVLRAHVDHDGGIIASPDSDMLFYGKDAYAYVWPRDAGYIALTLDRAGYSHVSKKFFRFAKDVLHPDGYLHHKFQTDKSLGSTWHSSITQKDWLADKILQLPIQEDETATVLYALGYHFQCTRDIEFIEHLYKPMIEKMANFLVAFRDRQTGLPIHSYDLWEEVTGVSTYTCCTIYGALQAAANISQMLGKQNHADNYRAVAQDIRRVMLEYLFDDELQSFVRYATITENGVERTKIVDASSLYGLWYYDVLEPNHPKLKATVAAVEDRLHLKQGIGGFIRYEGDNYYREPEQGQSNPWIITTLWNVQRRLKYAESTQELRTIIQELQWVVDRLGGGSLLAEQFHPLTGEAKSVIPLAWSHAEYVNTVLMYLQRLEDFGEYTCSVPLPNAYGNTFSK